MGSQLKARKVENELTEPMELIANMMAENIDQYSRMSEEVQCEIIEGSGKGLPTLLRAIEMDRLARTLGNDFVYGVPEGPARDYARKVRAAYEAQNEATVQGLLEECGEERSPPELAETGSIKVPNHNGSCDRCRIVLGKWTDSCGMVALKKSIVAVELCKDCHKMVPKDNFDFAKWAINDVFGLEWDEDECRRAMSGQGPSLWELRTMKLRTEGREDPEIPEPPRSEEVKKLKESFKEQARAMKRMKYMRRGLTPREAEVFIFLNDGMRPWQIAEELGIKTQTVNTLIRRIQGKLAKKP
jgi:DNA-binding CsgD family transcriptional regulator